MSEHPEHRCGYVGIVGRPNVGKSTLLNRVMGEKVSITSSKAQTTRNRVVGLLNTDDMQAVLVDTPGFHQAWSSLNKALAREVEATLLEVDAICLMVDLVPAIKAAQEDRPVLSKGEQALLERCAQAGVPVVLGLNKVDLVEKGWVLPVIEAWKDLHDFHAIVPLSALKDRGTEELLAALTGLLPKGPALFPKDQLMDTTERFVVSEIIREKLFHNLNQELPYSVAVVIDRFREAEDSVKPRIEIVATILVERPSQKGIVIGKGGQMLKRVGTAARKDIMKLLACRVRLDLHVKVEKEWTNNPRILRELGFSTES
jgi:GTP-binding protein Era